jgi:hypothetical protein
MKGRYRMEDLDVDRSNIKMGLLRKPTVKNNLCPGRPKIFKKT